MRTRLVVLGAIVAAVALPTAYGASTFTDAVGDHGMTEELTAPDITSVDVSNTPTGLITFRVGIGNYQALPPRSRIAILFDLDKDLTTAELGFERAVSHRVDETGQSRLVLERWDEPSIQYVELPSAGITSSFSGGVFTLTVPRAALGNTIGFDFGLYAALFGTNARDRVVDSAPNEDRWDYALAGLPAPNLATRRLVVSPKRPVAGRSFALSAIVIRSDTGGTVTTGSVACVARVAQARVQARGSFGGAGARCVIAIPRTARGKTLTGSLTVRSAGAKLTKRFSYRVG